MNDQHFATRDLGAQLRRNRDAADPATGRLFAKDPAKPAEYVDSFAIKRT